jgi:hypothetical protein
MFADLDATANRIDLQSPVSMIASGSPSRRIFSFRRTAEKAGWNEGLERTEGSLLGYADWQNDVHIGAESSELAHIKDSPVPVSPDAGMKNTGNTVGLADV